VVDSSTDVSYLKQFVKFDQSIASELWLLRGIVDINRSLIHSTMSSIAPSMLLYDISIVSGVLIVTLGLEHVEALRANKYVSNCILGISPS
jgi:hypothetical protein